MGESLSQEKKRDALERVLTSRTFEKSGRARDLLSYIVSQDLSGNAAAIKGFSIAVDVFGKDETFDAVSDPLVRVQAGRLREYLAEYYSREGADDPVIIEVPRGAYRPVFAERRDLSSAKVEESPSERVAESASARAVSASPRDRLIRQVLLIFPGWRGRLEISHVERVRLSSGKFASYGLPLSCWRCFWLWRLLPIWQVPSKRKKVPWMRRTCRGSE